MRPYDVYIATVKQAASQLPYEVEQPFNYRAREATPAALQGGGIGALGGLAVGGLLGAAGGGGARGAAYTALSGGLLGGLTGVAVGHAIGAGNAMDKHRRIVRDFENENGPLPYELAHPYRVESLHRNQGAAVGMGAGLMADALTSNRRDSGYSSYSGTSMGYSVGSEIGRMKGQMEFEKALADYKRSQYQKAIQ